MTSVRRSKQSRKSFALSVAEALADTITAFLTVQARQGLSAAYSEYLLYDPIVRVAHYRGWYIRGEWALEKEKCKSGDTKRIDFKICKSRDEKSAVYVEVKYKKSTRVPSAFNDEQKLKNALRQDPARSRALIIIAGKNLLLKDKRGTVAIKVKPELRTVIYKTQYTARHTNFGAIVYEVKKTRQRSNRRR